MGQSLSQLRIGGIALNNNEPNGAVDHENRGVVDQFYEEADEGTHEEDSADTEGEQWALEELADEYMHQRAFLSVAERFGIPNDYLSQDIPMEETEIEEDTYAVDDETEEKPSGKTDGLTSALVGGGDGSKARWQKDTLIGAGSFGRVYMRLNTLTGGFAAVKQVELVEDLLAQHRTEVAALQNEISVLQSLKHPNIVRYLGSSVEGSFLNIFLEFVPGGSIASLIKKFAATPEGGLHESLIRNYTKQILTGLQYLHANHIIHRDIKGANILVDDKGVVKLADFGASKKIEGIVAQAGAVDSIPSLKGTVFWMAPEVIKQSGYGQQADIWSVGCTVIEMATGRPPWFAQDDNQASTLFRIATSDEIPAPPSDFSDEGKDFLAQCFKRNPKERPTATKLLQHPWLRDAPQPLSVSSRSRPVSANLGNPQIRRFSGSAASDDVYSSPRSDQSHHSLNSRDVQSLTRHLASLDNQSTNSLPFT